MNHRVERWDRDEPPVAADIERQMKREGFNTFLWSDAPGAVYSEHSHGDDQSHWIVSGSLELTVRGYGRIELKQGDRDFMPAGTVHSARVLGSEPVVYLIGAK